MVRKSKSFHFVWFCHGRRIIKTLPHLVFLDDAGLNIRKRRLPGDADAGAVGELHH